MLFMYTLLSYINAAFFISKLFYVSAIEISIYLYFNDYVSFIHRITDKLASMNILYVKIFQAFALNHHFIDDSLNNYLLKFTDNAPWTLEDIDYETLCGICNDYNIHFPDGFEKPMNSGMISLVYKGQLLDQNNSSVIIKLKRMNIRQKLETATEELLYLVYILSFIPFFKKYDIDRLVRQNIELIRQQVRFDIEIKNMRQMKENCLNFKYVKIPEVYECSYPNAIIMEYIQGITIASVKETDYESYAKQLLKFGTVTILMHGFAHGDLHAGNILFIQDEEEENPKYKYKIGILDFGIMYEIDDIFRNLLYEIMDELTTMDSILLAEKMLDSGMFIQPGETIRALPKEHYDNIVYMISTILTKTFRAGNKCNQAQFYFFICEFHKYMINYLPQYDLTMSNNVIKTQLALAMTHGVTFKLCQTNWVDMFTKVMEELFHTNLLEKE